MSIVAARGVTVQWFRNEVRLADNDNISGSATNKLVIDSFSSEYEGTYNCVIEKQIETESSLQKFKMESYTADLQCDRK